MIATEGVGALAKKKYYDHFDYEDAEIDILDAGGDPDYLSYNDPVKRDKFLRSMHMDPKKYGSRLEEWQKEQAKQKQDDCFVTTACIRSRGLPDDCEELTTLRQFRDTYLRARQDGAADIERYYSLAPALVARINARPDASAIWERAYTDMVVPCVRLIRLQKWEEVYSLYKNYVLSMK